MYCHKVSVGERSSCVKPDSSGQARMGSDEGTQTHNPMILDPIDPTEKSSIAHGFAHERFATQTDRTARTGISDGRIVPSRDVDGPVDTTSEKLIIHWSRVDPYCIFTGFNHAQSARGSKKGAKRKQAPSNSD